MKPYRVAYAQRTSEEGVVHSIPFAKQIVGGDFDGWLRVDFNAVMSVLNKGHTQ